MCSGGDHPMGLEALARVAVEVAAHSSTGLLRQCVPLGWVSKVVEQVSTPTQFGKSPNLNFKVLRFSKLKVKGFQS